LYKILVKPVVKYGNVIQTRDRR